MPDSQSLSCDPLVLRVNLGISGAQMLTKGTRLARDVLRPPEAANYEAP